MKCSLIYNSFYPRPTESQPFEQTWNYISRFKISVYLQYFYCFSDCIELRDPHCAWDSFKTACVSVDLATSYHFLVQDVRFGNASKCKSSSGTFSKNVFKWMH